MSTRLLRKAQSGFTLIELLIVIGLLGALTALVLPSMMADREVALGKICDYNNAGTLRVLKQFQQFTGKLPSGLHTGLTEATGTTPMPGMPTAQKVNIDLATTHTLTQAEGIALKNMGLSQLAYGDGLNYADPIGMTVLEVTPAWRDDGNVEYTFNGRNIEYYNTAGATVVVLYVAPTTDWSASGDGGNQDWTGGNFKVGIDLAGKCPVPTKGLDGKDPEFAYYMAYFAVYDQAYTATRSASTSSAPANGSVPTPTFTPAGDVFGSLQGAKDAFEAWRTATTGVGNVTVGPITWTTTGTSTSGSASYTDTKGTESDTSDDITGTVTVVIADNSANGYATFLGTSCPECGVMNP